MRIAADGYIDLTDGRRVKTPGSYAHAVEPAPEAEALSFLLSHSFRGHRLVVRPLNLGERKRIKLAMWADSVSARMTLIDRVWRAITEPVLEPRNTSDPELIQVVQFEHWAYPIYFDGGYTRVIPLGGVSLAEVPPELMIRLDGQLVA
jgi:hypothetical protein